MRGQYLDRMRTAHRLLFGAEWKNSIVSIGSWMSGLGRIPPCTLRDSRSPSRALCSSPSTTRRARRCSSALGGPGSSKATHATEKTVVRRVSCSPRGGPGKSCSPGRLGLGTSASGSSATFRSWRSSENCSVRASLRSRSDAHRWRAFEARSGLRGARGLVVRLLEGRSQVGSSQTARG